MGTAVRIVPTARTQRPVFSHPMESREVKAEQRQQPVTPKKRRRPKPEKSAQANGGSSSSAAESSPLSRTSSSSPPSNDADGNGQQQQQQQHHQQGGGGKKPRLVWTDELHDLFVKAYDSLGDEAVPRRILEKMNEKMNVPEVSREKVASHLQKHKLHLRRLAEEASSHSPTEEAPACHPLRSLPPNARLAEVSHQAQLELAQVLQTPPPDCLSRSRSSIAANLQIVQSIQQQLRGPPIKEGQAQPGETMQRAPADSGSSPVGMETSTAAVLVPEANTEAVKPVIRMAQTTAAKAENAAEPERAAPAPGSILGQFWASPDDNEASTSSWDIFGLSRGT